MANGTPVIATVGEGGLAPSDPGAVEEWLALMPPYGGRASGRAICPFRRGVASSEAEMICSLEGRLATLERGGDAGHGRGLRRGVLERGGAHSAGPRGGCGWAALRTWAVCWASLSLFLSSRLEGGYRPSWARLLSMCLRFLGGFSPLIRVPLIMIPDTRQ